MSRGTVEVYQRDDDEMVCVGYGIYDGTADEWCRYIVDTLEAAWDRWDSREGTSLPRTPGGRGAGFQSRLWPVCMCGAPPVEVFLVNEYGMTTWNYGTACLDCGVIVDIDDEDWLGRPDPKLVPTREARPWTHGEIVETTVSAGRDADDSSEVLALPKKSGA